MTSHKFNHIILNYKFSPYLAILTTLAALLSWLILSSREMLNFVAEFGPIESATVILYLVATALIWLPSVIAKSTMPTRLATSVGLLAMAMREADLHKYINGTSMFKLNFWLGDYPIFNKLISALVILPIAIAVIFLIVKYAKPFFKALKELNTCAVTVMTFIVVSVVSKIIDRSLDVIKDFIGISLKDMPLWLVALQNAVEEYLELLIPVLAIVFIYQYVKLYQPNVLFPKSR